MPNRGVKEVKGLLVWTVRGLKVFVLLWILFPLFFGFKPLERTFAGFSLADLVLVGAVVLLVVSMILYRVFVGPPVLTEEEKKRLEEEEREFWDRVRNDPTIPYNPGYYDPFEDSYR